MTVESNQPSNGFAAVPTWMVRDTTRISKHALLVYVALAHRVDEYGEAFPSIATLASEARCSRTSAKLALDELQSLGILSRRRTQRDDGGWGHNIYRVHIGMRAGQDVRPSVSRQPGVGQPATRARSADDHEVHPVEVEPVEVEGDALFQRGAESSIRDPERTPSGIVRFDRESVSDSLPATRSQVSYLTHMYTTSGVLGDEHPAEFAALTRAEASDLIHDMQGMYRHDIRTASKS